LKCLKLTLALTALIVCTVSAPSSAAFRSEFPYGFFLSSQKALFFSLPTLIYIMISDVLFVQLEPAFEYYLGGFSFVKGLMLLLLLNYFRVQYILST